MNKVQLTLDFLTTKRNQALRDVESYSLMIAELEQLLEAESKSVQEGAFLKLVAQKGPND